jgi:hypothetical protein
MKSKIDCIPENCDKLINTANSPRIVGRMAIIISALYTDRKDRSCRIVGLTPSVLIRLHNDVFNYNRNGIALFALVELQGFYIWEEGNNLLVSRKNADRSGLVYTITLDEADTLIEQFDSLLKFPITI